MYAEKEPCAIRKGSVTLEVHFKFTVSYIFKYSKHLSNGKLSKSDSIDFSDKSGDFNTHFVKSYYSPEALKEKQEIEAEIAALVAVKQYLLDQNKLRLPN